MSGIRALWKQISNLFQPWRAHDGDLTSEICSCPSHHRYRQACADISHHGLGRSGTRRQIPQTGV
jgi:hypothetical protein